jgi:hypothetical protein
VAQLTDGPSRSACSPRLTASTAELSERIATNVAESAPCAAYANDTVELTRVAVPIDARSYYAGLQQLLRWTLAVVTLDSRSRYAGRVHRRRRRLQPYRRTPAFVCADNPSRTRNKCTCLR